MDYMLSPDGSTVYRLVPSGPISANTFNSGLLTDGYTATTGNDGSLSLTSYNAGFETGGGGAQITALYTLGAPLSAGQTFEWIQIGTDNDPFQGATSPYLDNAPNPSEPFYSYEPANQLTFYDYSRRPPSDLVTVANPINWSPARTAGDLPCPMVGQAGPQHSRGALDDRPQLFDRVGSHPQNDAEAVAQRLAQ